MQFLDILVKMDQVLCVSVLFCYRKSQGNFKKIPLGVCIDLENIATCP